MTIVTLTLNPALDVSASVDHVRPESKLRCSEPTNEPGGGGVNVSRVCRRMGEITLAVCPLGGIAGDVFATALYAEMIPFHRVDIVGDTRQSLAVFDRSSGDQFRFVFPGPAFSDDELALTQAAVLDAAIPGSILVISGSMPPEVDAKVFGEIVSSLEGVTVIIDTSGPAILRALQSGADVLKPSLGELETAFGSAVRSQAEVAAAARYLLSHSNVGALVVSMGARGAMLVKSSGECTRFRNPKVVVRSAVGAGDSMVAGIAVGLSRNLTIDDAVVQGVAAGAAAVMTPGSQLCEVAEIEKLRPRVEMRRLDI